LVVTPHVKTNWVNDLANPAINKANLDKYDDDLIALANAHNALGGKKVRAATTANITTTGTKTGANAIDGVDLNTGDRCFVKSQTNAALNGIYVVAAGAWGRAIDADSEADFAGGTLISVERGTLNGGKVFRCTNTGAVTINTTALTFEEVGAGGGSGDPGVYETDGTTPLKYTAFLVESGGNQTAALQNAVNRLFATAAYNMCLDLEGATITIQSPITIPTTHPGGIKSIINGEILASTSPAFTGGDHMIRCANVQNLYYMRLINVTMNGQNLASWIYWDIGNWMIQTCNFKNNKAGNFNDKGRLGTGYNRAGLFCAEAGAAAGDAGFWIDNCWFATDDGQIAPDGTTAGTSRWRWGIVSQTGDNKIGGGTTMSYFRHSLVSEGPGMIIHGFHPFQGQTGLSGDMTSHTAVVKFTNGRCGAQVIGLYLGKGFMEISNESNLQIYTGNPDQDDIGEIVISGMRAYMDNGVTGEAHIVARDYSGGPDNGCRVTDVSVSNSYFLNGGAVKTLATKLYNPAKFNQEDYHGIYFGENTFDTQASDDAYEVDPQANPATLRRNYGSGFAGIAKGFSFAGFMPFEGAPQRMVSMTFKPDAALSGSARNPGGVWVLDPDTAGSFDIHTGNSWYGTIIATATCNKDKSTFMG
jgi:hypothetical protein